MLAINQAKFVGITLLYDQLLLTIQFKKNKQTNKLVPKKAFESNNTSTKVLEMTLDDVVKITRTKCKEGNITAQN